MHCSKCGWKSFHMLSLDSVQFPACGKTGKEKDQYDIENSYMTNPCMVLSAIDHVHSKSPFETTSQSLTLRSIRKNAFSNNKSETIASTVEGFLQSLTVKGILERDAQFIYSLYYLLPSLFFHRFVRYIFSTFSWRKCDEKKANFRSN